MKAVLILALLAQLAQAQSVITGDALIDGKVGVGTTSPGARLEVRAGSAPGAVFRVSGVDESPLFTLGQNGQVGLSTSPVSQLDLMGAGDAADIGVSIRSGNISPATARYQVTFSSGGSSAFRHAIRTIHFSSFT